jgi:NTE family protein
VKAAPGGSRTAFVLSGGGSLGAVQVGMLQALTESGIRPDLLVGCSVGAINAAWIACCPDHEGPRRLSEIWCRIRRQDVFPINPWSGARGLLGHTNHLISNASLRALLEKHIGYERLEQAAIPLHVVVTNLKSGRAEVLSTGPVVPALLASSAIPGVFPPVAIGRSEFVDGGVASPTPIAAAIELGATEVYVLPIGYTWLSRPPSSALGMALQSLARFVDQRLDAEVATHRASATIHMLPTVDTPSVSPADFSRTEELIRTGYRSARRYLTPLTTAPRQRAVKPGPALKLASAATRAA